MLKSTDQLLEPTPSASPGLHDSTEASSDDSDQNIRGGQQPLLSMMRNTTGIIVDNTGSVQDEFLLNIDADMREFMPPT